jgi:hypothetical protein
MELLIHPNRAVRDQNGQGQEIHLSCEFLSAGCNTIGFKSGEWEVYLACLWHTYNYLCLGFKGQEE